MLATMETCLRRCRRFVRKGALDPRIQSAARGAAYGGGGLLLSAAALGGGFQPLAMGFIGVMTGWRALVSALGAMAGYRLFWGPAGLQGVVWSAAACLLALVLGKGKAAEDYPLLLPALTAAVTALTGGAFLFFRPEASFFLFFLRVCLAPVSALLFRRVRDRRETAMDWVCGGVACLALANLGPLGCGLAGLMAVWGSFPAAALAGVGLDLARVTAVPMSVVVCLAWFGRLLPLPDPRLRCAIPGIAGLAVMGLTGIWDFSLVPGLVLGGLLGYFLPPRPDSVHRQGELGIAQVRLELTAGVLAQTQRLLLEAPPDRIDEGALLSRAVTRGCGGCPSREDCQDRRRLGTAYLREPLTFSCPRPWQIQGELLRARDRLGDLKADRQRRQEYRAALIQQYRFLSMYLQRLSDQLPRRGERIRAFYHLEVSARSRGKEMANGDRCLAFPGTGCRFYVLLCDGMGTGLSAAWEGQSAGELLRQMLTAGFPPEHAFRSVNSILALRGQAGAVTLDLAEVRLDSGRVSLYKWGAAPSFLLRRGRAEKIGTAGPPPGLCVENARETVDRLSLRRGELLILVSDGIQIGEALGRREGEPPPPGELAQWLLKECSGAGEDDATVAVMRLTPRRLST